MEQIIYPDKDLAAIGLADRLASALRDSLASQERVTLAVPGGTTPGPIFDVLCATDLDWDRVCVLLTDERWVPDDHERSNAGLIRSRLLQSNAAKARFIPFYRAGLTAHEAAPVLSQELASEFPLSVVLLGMGEDMHTASLFPGASGVAEAMKTDAPLVCAIDTESQPEPRISLSAPALNSAMSKHLVIFGDAKKQALDASQSLPPEQAPVRAVMTGGTVHWAA